MKSPWPVILLVLLPACRQQMAQQPAYRPFRSSSVFDDGRSARPLVSGVVARGSSFATGKRRLTTEDWARITAITAQSSASPLEAAPFSIDWSFYQETFPISVGPSTLKRGEDRFNIYCSVCHDRVGNGKGMIVQRGFTAPPSFHTDWSRGFKMKGVDLKLRQAPVGYYFEVITHGFGAMPDYAEQIAPNDRWAIVAYIRTLQFSQHASPSDIRDAAEKKRLLANKESP